MYTAGNPLGSVVIDSYTAGAITFEIVAYNGANYASSLMRGHSLAFTMSSLPITGSGSPSPTFPDGVTSFGVYAVPEPATVTLAGLGLASLLIFRRRK